MQKTLSIVAGAALVACAVGAGGHAAHAQTVNLQLSAKDPKYNTPACRAARTKVREADGQAGQRRLSGAMAGALFGAIGGGGYAQAQELRVDLIKHDAEMKCMTRPPARPYLSPAATHGR